mmetsp:Transcript_16033/g.36816  ORF Transcript_16033/g.36816 Transcript_16033/m.36816 type:complete len:122 (+) Transcript_16033:104-469(+)
MQDQKDLFVAKPAIGDNCLELYFKDGGQLDCVYNESNLPVLPLITAEETVAQMKALHACVMNENNQNLTKSQQLLLKWHNRFGHLGMRKVQALLRSPVFRKHSRVHAVANCTPPLCASCQY